MILFSNCTYRVI